MKAKKIVFISLGCVTLALGSIGIVLPILPTVPFYLLTVFFFVNSSEKLHEWFVNTKVYKKHLESFVKKKGILREDRRFLPCDLCFLQSCFCKIK